MQKLELTGKQFGELTVLDYYTSADCKTYWKCLCVCGKTKTIVGVHLTRTHDPVRTCGCRTNIPRRKKLAHPRASAGYRMFHAAKGRAKEYELSFTIEMSDIVVPELCPLCEKKLIRGAKTTNASPSLDRLDNSRGYEKGNIAVICYQCNGTKRDHQSPEELEVIARNWRKLVTVP